MAAEKRGIQSIEIGGGLLRALAEVGQPMMLRDLAGSVGITAARAHPYLVSFTRIGLVEQSGATGRYELGPLALQIGLASLRRLEPVRIATEPISELAHRIGQTVALAVWGNHGPTIIRLEEASGAVHVNMRIGSVMSLLGTATGRVFAAFLPPKMLETFMDADFGRASVGHESAKGMTHAQIAAAVAEVRQHGLARAVGRPIPGVNAFSAPVFNQSGSIVLAVTTIGAAALFDAEWNSPIAKELLDCTKAISTRLGFLSKGSGKAA
jgi:DNA-binding IclR family transcriptional regulator